MKRRISQPTSLEQPQIQTKLHFIDSIFEGFINKQSFQQGILCGTGIAVDDEFNFVVSQWENSQFSGSTFIKFSNNGCLYGDFSFCQPSGIICYQHQKIRIFINKVRQKKQIKWAKYGSIIDDNKQLFYLFEITKKQQSSQKSPYKYKQQPIPSKKDVKIKILERCKINKDGSLAVLSKILKQLQSVKSLQYNRPVFSVKEQNQIKIMYSVFGEYWRVQAVNQQKYIRFMAKQNPLILVKEIYHVHENSKQNLFISLKSKGPKKLGLLLDCNNQIISLGTFDNMFNLSGLGISFNKNGQSFMGIYKDNIINKQFDFDQINRKKLALHSSKVKQSLFQEHLKSLNFINDSLYFSSINDLLQIFAKINKYIKVFERQFQKRNLHYYENDTSKNDDSQQNYQKYINNHYNSNNSNQNENNSRSPRYIESHKKTNIQLELSQSKKPGFIYDKKRSTSRTPSPLLRTPRSGRQGPFVGKLIKNVSKNNLKTPSPETVRVRRYGQRTNLGYLPRK